MRVENYNNIDSWHSWMNVWNVKCLFFKVQCSMPPPFQPHLSLSFLYLFNRYVKWHNWHIYWHIRQGGWHVCIFYFIDTWNLKQHKFLAFMDEWMYVKDICFKVQCPYDPYFNIRSSSIVLYLIPQTFANWGKLGYSWWF